MYSTLLNFFLEITSVKSSQAMSYIIHNLIKNKTNALMYDHEIWFYVEILGILRLSI